MYVYNELSTAILCGLDVTIFSFDCSQNSYVFVSLVFGDFHIYSFDYQLLPVYYSQVVCSWVKCVLLQAFSNKTLIRLNM